MIPGGVESVRLTLTMPSRPEAARNLALEGRATIAGRDVHRTAVPAEDMMQAFYYHHLVPVKDWLAEVTGAPRPNARAAFRMENENAVKLPSGGNVAVRVVLNAPRLADTLRLELNQPPEGVTIQEVETVREGVAIILKADATKVKAGLKGNLIVDAYMERAANPGRRVPLGTLPAIPFEIVPHL